MKTARKHHFLSQCYLKGFVGEKEQLFVVDLSRNRTFLSAADGIAAIRDFNMVEVDGVAVDQAEKDYSRFEAHVADALDRCKQPKQFHLPENRDVILELVALIACRNPRFRINFDEAMGAVGRKILDLSLETKERYDGIVQQMRASGKIARDAEFPDFATMKRVASGGTIHLSQTAKVALEVDTWAKMCPVIKSRRWMVLRAAAGTDFVTADHPISLSWISADRRAARWPPGFGLPGTEVIFPLSAELALHGSYEGRDNEVCVPADVVALINGATLANAEDQAYGVSGAAAYKLSEQDDTATLAEALKDQALASLRSSIRSG